MIDSAGPGRLRSSSATRCGSGASTPQLNSHMQAFRCAIVMPLAACNYFRPGTVSPLDFDVTNRAVWNQASPRNAAIPVATCCCG